MEISIHYDEELTVIKISGEATSQNASQFCLSLKEVLLKKHWVILDLSELTYICSGSMGCIIASVNRARQAGGKLLTVGMTENVKKVFDLIKFSEIAEITNSPVSDIDEAKGYLCKMMKKSDS